jgi:citrate lyase beta subunit
VSSASRNGYESSSIEARCAPRAFHAVERGFFLGEALHKRIANISTMPETRLATVRTLLFTPGDRPDRFDKAQSTGADGQILDLEDAVGLARKDEARAAVIDYLRSAGPDERFLRCLRINGLQTPAGFKDVSALADSGVRPDAIVVPKSEHPAELRLLARVLAPRSIPFVALIETALGLRHAEQIARRPDVAALAFGGVDLAADLGAELDWEPMLPHRAHVVRAAAAAGIVAWDVPYLHLRDADDGPLIAEAQRSKALGYTGKMAVHPRQVAPIMGVFTPSPDEVAHARRVVDAYERAAGGVCEVDGKMIDVPVYRSARRVIARAARS